LNKDLETRPLENRNQDSDLQKVVVEVVEENSNSGSDNELKLEKSPLAPKRKQDLNVFKEPDTHSV
tara:strand:- start:493 stop:690 length:198 start_codon:yes stop_codon:yes gene_type:complete